MAKDSCCSCTQSLTVTFALAIMAKHVYSIKQQSSCNALQIPRCTTKEHTLQGAAAIGGLWVAHAMKVCKT